MTAENEPICRRCGKCCHTFINGKATMIECQYIVRFPSGRTLCRVYDNRLGRKLLHDNVCILRKNSRFNYEGCPYNVEGKPYWEKEVEETKNATTGDNNHTSK